MEKIKNRLKSIMILEIIVIIICIFIGLYFLGNYKDISSVFLSVFFTIIALILIIDIKN